MYTLNGNVGTLDNNFFNAAGCGLRPFCAFTKNCKSKVANWQQCVANNSELKQIGKYGLDPGVVVPLVNNPNAAPAPAPIAAADIPNYQTVNAPSGDTSADSSAPPVLLYASIGLGALVAIVIVIKIVKS